MIGNRGWAWDGLFVAIAAVTVAVAGCSGGSDDDEGEAVDGGVTLGASVDCLEDPFCVPGLRDVYEVDLEEGFEALEPSAVVASLGSGAIDVGVMFSTDAALGDPDLGLVVLDDDEGMTAADNVVAIAAEELDDAYGDDLADVVNVVSAALTTDGVIELNARHETDGEDADAVAAGWLEDQGLADGDDADRDGPSITIGVRDFQESAVLSEVYMQALEASGFEVETRSVGGFSDLVFSAFENDTINLAVGYLATELDVLAEDDVATSDADDNLDQLESLLADRDLVAYEPAAAISAEVFVMTSDRAQELDMASLSDLD